MKRISLVVLLLVVTATNAVPQTNNPPAQKDPVSAPAPPPPGPGTVKAAPQDPGIRKL
ncbi:MAG: hypothetical protein ABIP63_10430 [Thermoanaerobaculia bacterium]